MYLIFDCEFLKDKRKQLEEICRINKLEFNISTLLANKNLEIYMQEFISFILDYNYQDH